MWIIGQAIILIIYSGHRLVYKMSYCFLSLFLLPDTGPYIEEILSKVEDEGVCQNIREFLINRRRLDIGDLLGKGN